MSELALAQITTNDSSGKKIFRHFGSTDPISLSCYGLFGGNLDRHPTLDQDENPISGIVRLLGEQTRLDVRPGKQLIFGIYRQYEVPLEYPLNDVPIKVHFFEAFIREGVNYEPAFTGVDHLVATNKELLKEYDVVPMVRFILEQMAAERHSKLMNGKNI